MPVVDPIIEVPSESKRTCRGCGEGLPLKRFPLNHGKRSFRCRKCRAERCGPLDTAEWMRILDENRERIEQRVKSFTVPSAVHLGCIEWAKGTAGGYPLIGIKTRSGWRALKVSRLLLALNGDFPIWEENVFACHRCDNPKCVNIDHLFSGTQKDNMGDASRKGRVKVPRLSGVASSRAKLSADQVREIRRCADESSRAVAARYGVTKIVVLGIRNRRTYQEVD